MDPHLKKRGGNADGVQKGFQTPRLFGFPLQHQLHQAAPGHHISVQKHIESRIFPQGIIEGVGQAAV